MEQKYKISIGYKIFYGIGAAAIAGFGIFLLSKTPASNNITGGIIISAVLFALSCLFALYIIKRRVILTDEEIIVKGAFGTRQAYINDIKGIRSNGKAIFIYLLDDNKKKITINDYDAIGKSDELKNWLKSNLRDLDSEEYEEQKAVILQDSDLGFTQEEREAKLKKVSVIALVYSGIAFVLMLVSIFFHQSNLLLSMTLLAFPLIGIALMAFSRGLIRLNIKKGSAYPSVFIGLVFACFALLMQSIIDTKILDFSKVWIPVIVGAIILMGILSLIILKQPNQTIKGQIVPVLLISVFFSFGAVHQVNRNFDQATPQVFSATVTDQYIKRGKSTSYHIVITGWGTHQEEDDVTVSSDFYEQVPVGSKVKVNLKQGKLHIPWYYITQ
jgi:multidrug transporter EmrE-like cation transporter